MTTATTPTREYDIPDNADVYECPYCDVVEPREDLRDLHIGHDHEDVADEEEQETFRQTFERESNQVFIYHLKVISLVVAIYFVFLFAFSALS